MSDKHAYGVLYPKLELICSDGDGTLWDTEEMLFAVHKEMLAERGHELTEAHYRQMVGRDTVEAAKMVIELFGLREDQEAYRAERRTRMHARLPSVRLMPGALQAFDTFKKTGAPTALVSSAQEAHVATIIDAHDIRKRFALLVTANTPGLPALKPDPAPYLFAARHFHAKPMRCVAFEDTPHGAVSARTAGMIVVGIPHRFSPREELAKAAHYVIPEGQTIGDFEMTSIAHLLPC